MNTLSIASFVALAVLVPAAAGAQVYPDRIVVKTRHVVSSAGYQRRDRGDAREEATDRTTRTFKLGTGGTLTLGNIAGDITVTRGSGSDTVVDIVKTAHGRDAADARDLLQIVTVDASERNGRAEVKAHYPGGDEMKRNGRRNLNVSIAYTVTAPAGIHLAVETISGNVKIADIKGDVTASSISGDVRISGGGRIGSAKSISGAVEILDGQVDGPLEASSVSGDVTVRRLSAQRVEAGSVSGNIHLEDLKCDRVEAHTTSGTIGFAGALARNGHYELKGFSGEIRVALSGGTGFDVDASSFSGQIRSDDYPITARGRLSGRHLTGTWGDGSAVLDLSTFSGSIVIAKR